MFKNIFGKTNSFKIFAIMIFCIMLIYKNNFADNLKITAFSFGIGDWITLNDGETKNRDEFGTLPSLGVYAKAYTWNLDFGLPLKSTFKKVNHDIRYSLGEASLGLSKNWGDFTPRLGLQFPLYKWSVEDPAINELFIGSGNVNVTLGSCAKLFTQSLPPKWTSSASAEFSTAITQALADYGSSHALGIVQIERTLGNRWKAGVNTLVLWDYYKWIPSYWDEKEEVKFSIVPGFVMGVRLGFATYVDAKIGMSVYSQRVLVETKYPDVPQSSFYGNLSVFQGF